ncbi:histidine kinase [Nocardioides sp. TF02-7]|uniref:sensor histidine kinase n=1 Tax=Nocardioides sp. TF02-7 TaxID=2917724 RepID=UPI001F05972A|nr:histidine kinase [Nocardioides sp. TF02-7]UMG91857.1 histidine kinase dimerization/phosphoacceptor domain-containing protein [Nocardioides sp. TF02-7]
MTERLRSLRPPARVQDVALALLVAVMQVQGTMSRAAADPDTVLRPLAEPGHLGHALLAASGLVLVLRRRYPFAVFVATALGSLAYYALDFPDGPGWLALFVALYTLTAHGDGRRSLVLAGVGITVLAACWLVAAADVEPRQAIGWVFFRIGASVMSAALGESLRSRRVIATEALARAELAERTREEEARARVAQERLRITREVHDTVAHAVAVINVQAGVTAHVLDRRPDRARAALVAIEQTSSRALEEMRAVLGVLRGDDGARTTSPGLDQVDALVERARDAGLDVQVAESRNPCAAGSEAGSERRRHRGVPDRAGGDHQRHPARGPDPGRGRDPSRR